jgi:hypothetical protein
VPAAAYALTTNVFRAQDFTLNVTSDDDLTAIALSPAEHNHLSMEGDWLDGRAGGCKNHPSWRNNPQFHFKVIDLPIHQAQPSFVLTRLR